MKFNENFRSRMAISKTAKVGKLVKLNEKNAKIMNKWLSLERTRGSTWRPQRERWRFASITHTTLTNIKLNGVSFETSLHTQLKFILGSYEKYVLFYVSQRIFLCVEELSFEQWSIRWIWFKLFRENRTSIVIGECYFRWTKADCFQMQLQEFFGGN